jgi:hypothetical protein
MPSSRVNTNKDGWYYTNDHTVFLGLPFLVPKCLVREMGRSARLVKLKGKDD